jgi:hypothetical protein
MFSVQCDSGASFLCVTSSPNSLTDSPDRGNTALLPVIFFIHNFGEFLY